MNAEIDNTYQSALNIRFGGEYAYKKLRLRAGYTITGRSLRTGSLTNNAYSFGLGLRENTFYIDLAYLGNTINGIYNPYDRAIAADKLNVDTKLNRSQIILTVGYKF